MTTDWGYEGKIGPEHWGKLDKKFKLCDDGLCQSPIDIKGERVEDTPPLVTHYWPSELTIFYNGQTVQVDYEEGSWFGIDTRRYNVVQFHFHTPGENTIRGKSFPMELHIVHADSFGNAAVIAVMIEAGAHHAAYDPIIKHLPTKITEPTTVYGAYVKLDDLLPASRKTYQFMGSLTTPPCTEGVHWFVMQESITLSGSQIQALRDVMGHNSRPVQPLNGREVTANGK